MKSHLCIALALAILAFTSGCTQDRVAGGTTTTTNERIMGTIVYPDGSPARGAQVKLIPQNYNPISDTSAIPQKTTDDSGKYVFEDAAYGTYTIASKLHNKETQAIAFGIRIEKDTVPVPPIALAKCGSIKIILPDNVDVVNGYVYVPGSDIMAKQQGNNKFIFIDSVPQSVVPSVNLTSLHSSLSAIIRYTIKVVAGDTVTVKNPSWQYSKDFYLNTTPAGANVVTDVTNFPVLIKLTSSNFDFTQAKTNGDDILFTKEDNTLLSYEIERFDPVAQVAEIWVKVDTVFGNSNTHYISMFWGNSDAIAISKSTAVFDTSNGFQGVWHLQELGNTTAFDATVNHYNGTPSGMISTDMVAGAVGNAKNFNGSTAFIQMNNTANSKLNFPEAGTYSVSAWVNVQSPAIVPEMIIGKGHSQYYLRYNYYSATSFWEFVEYQNSGKKINITETPAAPAFSWKYLVGVREGSMQRLFLDGEEVASDSIKLYPFNGGVTERDTTYDVSIGKHLQLLPEGYCLFKGIIDEVRISNVAYKADWIRLCYMNQRSDDKLISTKEKP